MTLRDDYEHWARNFARRIGDGWGAFLDRIHDDVDYTLVSANDSDTDVTAAELEELTDGSETTLHTHAADDLVAFRVIKSAAQSLSTATLTTVTWGTETYDYTDNFASNTFTAPSAGVYHFDAGCEFATNASGARMVEIVTGGTARIAQTVVGAAPGGVVATTIVASCDAELAASDAVTVRAWQDSGGALNVLTGNSFFSGHYIGAGGA